jgi:hypothetical protein
VTRYEVVPFENVAEICARNADSHAMETREKLGRPLRMDWKAYLDASTRGECVAVVAKKGDEIAGYSVYTLGCDPHSAGFTDAVSRFFYIFPKYRGGDESVRLIKNANALLKERGISSISYILESALLGRVLRRAGCRQTHIVWSS